MQLTEEQKNQVYNYLEGTCNSCSGAIDAFDLDCTEDDIQDVMLDFNHELCPSCGWWCECNERIPSDVYPGADGMSPDKYCDNCRPGVDDYKFEEA